MTSPFSNSFNSHGEDTMNLNGVGSFPMDSFIRNHESNGTHPMFISSNQTNHHGLFSSSHSINSYQTSSHVSSSSYGLSNPFAPNYQMRTNMVPNVFDYSPMNNNPHLLSRVSITQTITNRYTAFVPTSSLVPSQNQYDRGINPTIQNPSSYSQNFAANEREILNPTPFNFVGTQREILNPPTPFNFVDNQREILNPPTPLNFVDNQREILNPPTPLNFVDNQREILNPTPLNTFQAPQNFAFPRHGDHYSFPPEHHPDQHVPQPRPVKKRSKPTNHFDGTSDNFDFQDAGEYDGQIHSLPYKKNGPYTCSRCESVFETSQKFASHVVSAHYKNETIEERARRRKAKNKNKRKQTEMSNEESQEVQPENEAVAENGGNNNIASDPEVSQPQPIVKEEPSYEFV